MTSFVDARIASRCAPASSFASALATVRELFLAIVVAIVAVALATPPFLALSCSTRIAFAPSSSTLPLPDSTDSCSQTWRFG